MIIHVIGSHLFIKFLQCLCCLMKPVCTPLAYALLSTLLHAPTLQRASRRGNLYFTLVVHVNLTRRFVRYINSQGGDTRITPNVGARFQHFQAFEKTMAGLTRLIRTFLTRLTALVVSACAIVITSCCLHSLLCGGFCFRVAVRLA